MCVQGHIKLLFFFAKSKVSVSVSMFETDDGLSLSLNFWYQRQKSQYQSQFLRPIYKVSVSVSKFDTNFKSLSLSIKNWDQLHWVSVSVSTYKIWSRTSLRDTEYFFDSKLFFDSNFSGWNFYQILIFSDSKFLRMTTKILTWHFLRTQKCFRYFKPSLVKILSKLNT